MIEVLKQAYQLLLTEPHAPTVCDQLEVIFRQAIAELESQEPVAWMSTYKNDSASDKFRFMQSDMYPTPVFTHPPQRKEQEPVAWRDAIVVNLLREGINKHRARELADHFISLITPPAVPVQPVFKFRECEDSQALAAPVQKPVAHCEAGPEYCPVCQAETQGEE
jgi:hypothetical protein